MGSVKFFSISKDGNGNIEIKQVTELGITAPQTIVIPIAENSEFKHIPIEVLKIGQGAKDKVQILAEFNESEKIDYSLAPLIDFSKGFITLSGTNIFKETEVIELSSKKISTIPLLINEYSKIEALEGTGLKFLIKDEDVIKTIDDLSIKDLSFTEINESNLVNDGFDFLKQLFGNNTRTIVDAGVAFEDGKLFTLDINTNNFEIIDKIEVI